MVVEINQINHTYLKIHAEKWLLREIWEYFSFYVPGYQWMPAFKNKMWNGKINLFNLNSRTLYVGLLKKLIKFCKEREYEYRLGSSVRLPDKIELDKVIKAAQKLNLPYSPRDYQLEGVKYILENKRGIILSPTGSGKSLVIYMLLRMFNKKSLLIVPTTSLCFQMYGDFGDYSINDDWNHEEHCHQVYAGKDKFTEKLITISTWQSIYKMPKEYFDQFDVVICDEAHQAKSKSIVGIMEKLSECPIRFGTTGTIDERESQAHPLTLTGLFGPIKQLTTTKKLMDKKQLSSFMVNMLVLNYPDDVKKEVIKMKYKEEIDYIVENETRNKFILNLAKSLKGNTLILYNFVEKHGEPLFKLINKEATEHQVHFVSGDVKADDRENIRKWIEDSNNNIIVGSFGTLSTGVNFKNLHNIIFSSPSKSQIRILQSIGRGLRKTDTKTKATLYDIVDDFAYGSRNNYALDHGLERLQVYIKEGFNYSHNTLEFSKLKELYERNLGTKDN